MDALVNCRTAVLGGFKAHCDHCGAETIQYASCRNRHCPKCQTLAQTRWVERQSADLLDIGYWHVVFTLPHDLNPVAQGNPALIYRLLFKAASQTLLEFGRNPRWLGDQQVHRPTPRRPRGHPLSEPPPGQRRQPLLASSASPWCCIHGARIWDSTSTSTVSSPAEP